MQRTVSEQMKYDMCSSCIYDYGDFQSTKGPKKSFRGCRRYLDTGQHLDPQPYVDADGAHCEFWTERKGSAKHPNIRYTLKPINYQRKKGIK